MAHRHNELIRIFVFLIVVTLPTAFAANLVREARIAAEIEEAIIDGDIVWLQDGEHEFLSVYRRTDIDPMRGAAIVLHGRGAHPEWNDVVRPLAADLPDYGWDTLAIQLPVAAADAPVRDWAELVPEASPRIAAALAFLRERRISNVVLIAHSMGCRMATNHLSTSAPAEVKALVLIGMSANRNERQTGALGELRKLKVPILDIYGERDLDSVLSSAKERRLAAQDAGNSAYTQAEIAGADHFFTGIDDQLASRVRAWLARVVTSGKENRPASPAQ